MNINGEIESDREGVPTGFFAEIEFDAWDYFAGQALAGLSDGFDSFALAEQKAKSAARVAAAMADAMMAERAKRKEAKS